MKKFILLALSVLVIITLISCGGETPLETTDGSTTAEIIDVMDSGYKVIYDITDSTAISIMTEMLNEINTAIGAKPQSSHSGNPESEFEIEFALKSDRNASETVKKELDGYKNDSRDLYIMKACADL